LVEIEPVGECPRERTRSIEEEAATIRRISLDNNKIGQDLTLGGQQRRKTGMTRGYPAEIGGYEAVVKIRALGSCPPLDAPVREKCCFHDGYLPDIAKKRKASRRGYKGGVRHDTTLRSDSQGRYRRQSRRGGRARSWHFGWAYRGARQLVAGRCRRGDRLPRP